MLLVRVKKCDVVGHNRFRKPYEEVQVIHTEKKVPADKVMGLKMAEEKVEV